MITQARSICLNQNQTYVFIININFLQKLFLVVLMVVKLRASPFVLIDPSTGRAVEQVDQIPPICEAKKPSANCNRTNLLLKILPMPGKFCQPSLQPRPYWHWSNRVVEQEEEPTNLQVGS